MLFAAQLPKREIRVCPRKNVSGGIGALCERPTVKKSSRARELTTPDLVLLSLLAERPMHGYQANQLLEFRHVRDWADISRPQIYYSLEKLLRLKFLRATHRNSSVANRSEGPERRVLAATSAGRAALAAALERESWTTVRDRPPFLTWLALSWQARPSAFQNQLSRRRTFLQRELAREKQTLRDVIKEVGHRHHEAVWMLTLTIDQLALELRWLRKLQFESHQRARARNPVYPTENSKIKSN
jgi:DNA-binding PadR family transcriptional regulator